MQLWFHYGGYDGDFELLLQVHDNILAQVPEVREHKAKADILACMNVPFNVPDFGMVTIPSEVSTGWNWGKAGADNPLGLKEFALDEADPRVRPTPTPLFDRPAVAAK